MFSLLFFIFIVVRLGIKPRSLRRIGKCFATEVEYVSCVSIRFVFCLVGFISLTITEVLTF